MNEGLGHTRVVSAEGPSTMHTVRTWWLLCETVTLIAADVDLDGTCPHLGPDDLTPARSKADHSNVEAPW